MPPKPGAAARILPGSWAGELSIVKIPRESRLWGDQALGPGFWALGPGHWVPGPGPRAPAPDPGPAFSAPVGPPTI